jgi:hypothetical protein
VPVLEPVVIPKRKQWEKFILFCEQLKFGEIEKLKIQDGVPMIAEKVTARVKFE